MLTFILSFLGLTIFLFTLYSLSKDDFVLLRRNISLENVFNLAFLVLGVGLFFARFFYVLLHFKTGYLNPLVFFHIINYPGLSLIGGVTGALIFFYLFLKRKRTPVARLFDIYMVAFLSSLPLTALPFFLVKKISIILIINVLLFILYVLLFYLLLKIFKKDKFSEGSIGAISLIIIALFAFIQEIFIKQAKIILFFSSEQILLLFLILFGIIMFFTRQKISRS